MSRTNSKRQRQIEQLRQTAEDAREQLAAVESQIEELEESDGGASGPTPMDEARLALNVMHGNDVVKAKEEQLSPPNYLREQYGVDVSELENEAVAREQVADAREQEDGGRSPTPRSSGSGSADKRQLALSAMHGRDVVKAEQEQLSPSAYLRQEYGVDASQAENEAALREQLADVREGEGE